MKPNLFAYATSELSQDAVIAWLAAWADPSTASADSGLHALGRSFLQAIFAKHGKSRPEVIHSIKVRRQHLNIDVLVTLNDTIAILIEDKIGSIQHSDQLRRYTQALAREQTPPQLTLPVYVQTGDQCSYHAVAKAGYVLIKRSEMIALLGDYLQSGGTDSIARDFHDRLVQIEGWVMSFRTHALDKWGWHAWQGFFLALQSVLENVGWDYVANPSGGFQGLWWHWYEGEDSNQYLQLQEDRLCFKISVKDRSRRGERRHHWHQRILKAARELGQPVIKPARLGSGESMTVALYDGEYRVLNAEGVLDFDATLARLRDAQAVLDLAVKVGG